MLSLTVHCRSMTVGHPMIHIYESYDSKIHITPSSYVLYLGNTNALKGFGNTLDYNIFLISHIANILYIYIYIYFINQISPYTNSSHMEEPNSPSYHYPHK